MGRFLALRERFSGTLQDLCAGIAIVWFVIVLIAYLEAFA